MNLDFINDIVNGLKENKFVKDFTKEMTDYLENNINNESKDTTNDLNNESNDIANNNSYINLNSDNLEINDKKIISKYKDEMLTERANILQNYENNTKEEGEMYYIYDKANEKGEYNLCNCDSSKSHEVITKKAEELSENAELGNVLRKDNEENFVIDSKATKQISDEINSMIQEKVEEQERYLDSKRVEGHIYEVGEKDSGRVWLYDLNNQENGGMDGIEEINFPTNLYATAKEGDKFVYENNEYHEYEE